MTDVTTAATIASLRAEVERLKAELQGEREDLAACYKAKATLIDERNACLRELDFARAENVRLTNEAATARERAGVLEREVRAWREADRAHNLIEVVRVHGEIHESIVLQQACRETDSLNAIDNEQFGGGQ